MSDHTDQATPARISTLEAGTRLGLFDGSATRPIANGRKVAATARDFSTIEFVVDLGVPLAMKKTTRAT